MIISFITYLLHEFILERAHVAELVRMSRCGVIEEPALIGIIIPLLNALHRTTYRVL